MIAPRYPHHCSNCVFVGQYGIQDLYYCEQHSIGNKFTGIVRRYGPAASNYSWIMRGDFRFILCGWLGPTPEGEAYLTGIVLAARAGLIDKTAADNVLNGRTETAG